MNTDIEKNPETYRLLIADDEVNTRQALSRAMELMGYAVDEAADGKEVLEKLSQHCYDLLLLDLRMPEMDGLQVMQQLREQALDTAIIILTAHATLDSAITAVKAGANDYLLKPQHTRQIIEAVQKALAQRQERKAAAPMSGSGPSRLTLDAGQHLLIIDYADSAQKGIALTGDQTSLLVCLMAHAQQVLTSAQIAEEALSYPQLTRKEAESIVRPHILRLRRKIERDPACPDLVRTVRGVGYIYVPPGSEPGKII